MASTTPIRIYCIAKTKLVHNNIFQWLEDLEATDFKLPDEPSEAECLIGLAAKRCYMSFQVGLNENVTKIRKDWFDYLGNILASGHGSVLEHASYSFAIEGVSRVFTAEMNRHRAGVAISEGSMRYIRNDQLKYWLPKSIEDGCSKGDHASIETEKIFKEVFDFIEGQMSYLNAIWGINEKKACPNCNGTSSTWPCSKCSSTGEIPAIPFHRKKELTSLFRRLIPMGVATGGVWTFNLRALRHVIALRTHPAAEEEIAIVVGKIAEYMLNDSKILFGDFVNKEGHYRPEHVKV